MASVLGIIFQLGSITGKLNCMRKSRALWSFIDVSERAHQTSFGTVLVHLISEGRIHLLNAQPLAISGTKRSTKELPSFTSLSPFPVRAGSRTRPDGVCLRKGASPFQAQRSDDPDGSDIASGPR